LLEKKKNYKVRWYIPIQKWVGHRNHSIDSKVSTHQQLLSLNEDNKIGDHVQSAIDYIFKPYQEIKKRTKEDTIEDEYKEFKKQVNGRSGSQRSIKK